MQCGAPIKVALQLIAATAARPGEVCSPRGSDLDIELGVWTVPISADKMKTGRQVPLSRGLVHRR